MVKSQGLEVNACACDTLFIMCVRSFEAPAKHAQRNRHAMHMRLFPFDAVQILLPNTSAQYMRHPKHEDCRKDMDIREQKRKASASALPVPAPTRSIALALNVHDHIHASFSGQIVNAVAHVFEIRVRRGNNMDDAGDLRSRLRRPMIVPMAVAMMIMRVATSIFIVKPEAWHSVADDAAELGELLQGDFDAVFEVVRDNEEESLARGDYKRDRGGEDEDRNHDCCQWVPKVPGFVEGHGGGEDDSEGATGVGGNVQENAVHVVIVAMIVAVVVVRVGRSGGVYVAV